MIPSDWVPASKIDFFKRRGRNMSVGERKILKNLANMCDLNCLSIDERFYQRSDGIIVALLEVKDGKLPVIQDNGYHYKSLCRTVALKVFDYVSKKLEITMYRTSLYRFRISVLAAKYLDEKATLKYLRKLKKKRLAAQRAMAEDLKKSMENVEVMRQHHVESERRSYAKRKSRQNAGI